MKKILFIGSILFALSSCQSEPTSESSNSGSEPDSEVKCDQDQGDSEDLYSEDWEAFKQAVITKNKDAVMTFALKNDQCLRDIFDMSYDYIFDDVMIENIEKMNYQDLPISSQNPNWKKLSTYYYSEGDEDTSETGTFLFFEERPEGLRIVKFLAAE